MLFPFSLGPEPQFHAPFISTTSLPLPRFSFPSQVEYKDFPKNNKNEFVSLINCSSQPPLISHGIGKDLESCHDMVRSPTQWAWFQPVAGLRKTGKGVSNRLQIDDLYIHISDDFSQFTELISRSVYENSSALANPSLVDLGSWNSSRYRIQSTSYQKQELQAQVLAAVESPLLQYSLQMTFLW